MKILVVGGAGYIGSICAELLLDERYQVAVLDNLIEGHQRALDPRAEFFHGDLSEREKTAEILRRLRPDAVMHFAASALVGESMRDPSKYFRNNICGGLNLLDAMLAADCRHLVFSSTCATFGLPKRVPIDETFPQSAMACTTLAMGPCSMGTQFCVDAGLACISSWDAKSSRCNRSKMALRRSYCTSSATRPPMKRRT